MNTAVAAFNDCVTLHCLQLFSWGMLAVGEQLEVQDGHLTLLLLLLGAGLGASMAQNLAFGPGAAVARLTGPAVVAGLYVALAVSTALPMYSIVFKPSSNDPQYSADQGTASSQGGSQAAGEVRGSQQGEGLQAGVPSETPVPDPGPSPMAEPGQVSSRRRSLRGSKLGRSAAQVSASSNAADAAATSGGQGGSGGGEGGSSGVDAVQRLPGGWRERPDAPQPLMDSRLVSAGGWDQEEDSLARAAEEAWGRVAELPLGHALWLVALVVGLYMPGLGISGVLGGIAGGLVVAVTRNAIMGLLRAVVFGGLRLVVFGGLQLVRGVGVPLVVGLQQLMQQVVVLVVGLGKVLAALMVELYVGIRRM
ncbi:hypothetical protein V8C86DRAFT_1751333 [Haematococcus lacustris]